MEESDNLWREDLSGGGCDRDHKWPLEIGWYTGNCRERLASFWSDLSSCVFELPL